MVEMKAQETFFLDKIGNKHACCDHFDTKLHYATVPSGYKPTVGVRSRNDRLIMVTIAYLFLLACALMVDIWFSE